ncbi:hypothetical protein ACLOJK_023394 [Asimina triloba]
MCRGEIDGVAVSLDRGEAEREGGRGREEEEVGVRALACALALALALALACAVVSLRPRLRHRPFLPSPFLPARLALPRLPTRLASPPCSLFPSSSLPSPIFLPPVSRHLPPPFPVSVLPPYPVSLRGSASSSPCYFLLPSPSRACFLLTPPPPSRASTSASPSSPSLSPLRLCFFLVGEAAVDIQLQRSLLSGSSFGTPCCRDPAPGLQLRRSLLSRSNSGAPCSRSVQSQRLV